MNVFSVYKGCVYTLTIDYLLFDVVYSTFMKRIPSLK